MKHLLAVLSPFLLATPAMAGNSPDQWLGDVKLKLEMKAALPGVFDSIIVDGTVALTVMSESITGTGTLTAHHQWRIRPCSARGDYPFDVTHEHERKHRRDIWAGLRRIANEIETTMRTRIPGPPNARPQSLARGEEGLKREVSDKIKKIAGDVVNDLRSQAEAFENDDAEKRRKAEACPALVPRPR
jgi:hypothetical protein